MAKNYGHRAQRDVAEFHELVCAIGDGETPMFQRPELRQKLISEEAKELVEAIDRRSMADAIDGMCDLLYVVYGTACEFGVDISPFWDEVHASNMRKKGGVVREDGKRMKPEGWTPPNIAGVLAAQDRKRQEGE